MRRVLSDWLYAVAKWLDPDGFEAPSPDPRAVSIAFLVCYLGDWS
jgi:hypothetical protein